MTNTTGIGDDALRFFHYQATNVKTKNLRNAGRVPGLSTLSGAGRAVIGTIGFVIGLGTTIFNMVATGTFGIGKMCGNARCSTLYEKRVKLMTDGLRITGAGFYNVLRGAIEAIPVAGNLAMWGIDKGCESLYQKRISHIKPEQ